MNTAPAGFFSPQANEMDASSKLPFFPKDFVGLVKVDRCKGITTRAGKRAFIAELEVVTSNLPSVQVGAKHSWYQDLTEVGTAYPACIGFLYACLGLDQAKDKAKIDATVKPKQDQYLNMAVNEDPGQFGGKMNILKGATLMLQTAEKEKKRSAGVFTLHIFTPAPQPAA